MIEREAIPTTNDDGGHTWAVILADSAEGLSRCLAHATCVSPPERTVVVVTASRPIGLTGMPTTGAHVLVEPLDRGSAASVLFPIHWIHARDRAATVVVFAGDRASSGLGGRLAGAVRYAERRPDRIVLLGLADRDARDDARLIVPGERLDAADGAWTYRVRALVTDDGERASASALRDAGVIIGSAGALIDAASGDCASLGDRLARAVSFSGQEHERWALRQAYSLAPPAELFDALLPSALPSLAVMAVAPGGVSTPGLAEHSIGARALFQLGVESSSLRAAPRATAALTA